MGYAERKFELPFAGHLVRGDVFEAGAAPARLILLHGAGQGTRDRYRQLRADLAACSIGSVAFDFIGFGETGGAIGASSLQGRVEQTQAVIAALGLHGPLCLLGASMGGYTAIKLLPLYPVASLMLFVPAVYTPAAYAIPFGPEFSWIIRQPQSWQATDAWDHLAAFTGRLLLVAAERDDVIPRAVLDGIYAAAAQARERRRYTVPASPHLLIQYLTQRPAEYQRVFAQVRHYCA